MAESLESIQQQVLDALVARFAAIVGDEGATRWYSVDRAVDFASFSSECLDSSLATIYIVSPDETPIEPATLTSSEAHIVFDISLARRLEVETENPFGAPAENRTRIQNRLIQDATRAINSDPALGGLAIWTYIRYENRKAEDTYIEKWAVAFMRIEVQAIYTDGAP